MERAVATRVVRPIDGGLLAAAAQSAARAIDGDSEPAAAIDAAMSSVFVLEHGRLWLVAQRGYAVVPDGLAVDTGITGRAIRLGHAQLAPDVKSDPDYIPALPGMGRARRRRGARIVARG